MHSSDLQRAGGIGQSPSTRVGPAEVHLLDRLRAFRRYRYVAAGTFVIVLAGATLLAYLETPLYRATVRLLIEIEDERSLAMEGVSATASSDYVQDPEPYFQTQYRILTGRDLARRASTKLGLTHHVEFSDAGAPTSGTRRVLSAARSVVAVPFRALTGRASPPAGSGQVETPEDAVVDRFASRVTVDPVRASRLVDVSFVATDAQLAARAANTLAEEYVQQNLELRRQNMARSLEWLAEELTRQKQTVEASERAMALYREQQNALSLEDRQNIVISRLNQLNDAATRARTVRAQKEALYRRVAKLPEFEPGDVLATDRVLTRGSGRHHRARRARGRRAAGSGRDGRAVAPADDRASAEALSRHG